MDTIYNLSAEKVLEAVNGSLKGLTNEEANERLLRDGKNVLERTRKLEGFKIFLRQFKSFIVYVMIAAMLLSLVIGGWVDGVIIGAIIVLNAVLGFIQEYRAEKSIELLNKLSSPDASVLRDGRIVDIAAADVVAGDIVIFEDGKKVVADCYLLEGVEVRADESLLTGESTPVEKKACVLEGVKEIADRKNMLFAGTSIVGGRGKAVVVATGMRTEMGGIAKLLQERGEKKIPLENKLSGLGMKISAAVAVLIVVIFGIFVFRGHEVFDGMLVAISLAVAAIPEGLPAIVTITLALGVQKMLKRNVLVRRLNSVETLGSTTLICADKTGTLTKNQMTVKKIFANEMFFEVAGEGYGVKGEFFSGGRKADVKGLDMLLLCGKLCNNAALNDDGAVRGDPTEIALLVAAKKAGMNEDYQRVKEVPFTSESKSMSTYNILGRREYLFVKAAPEILIKKCRYVYCDGRYKAMTAGEREHLLMVNEGMAGAALRVLGFGFSKEGDDKQLVFLGLMGMIDPERAEVKDAIETCKRAGIRVVMITGDHRLTAEAIARNIGIEGSSLTGEEIDRLDKEAFRERIKKVNIFARVNPGHKVKILEGLKSYGHIVAMTGDGVNDAPALKKADIGIAVGSGTDVAKEACDMVLRDDNFASMVAAIEEGRGIFDNIKKFINYLLSCNLAEVLIIFFAILIGFKHNGEIVIPFIAIHLLWINLVTDGLPALALGVDPVMKNIMERKPRNPNESIISRNLGWNIIFIGVLLTIAVLALFWYNLETAIKAQTVAFTALVVFEMVRLQIIRSQYKLGVFSNKYLLGAVGLSIGLQALILYTPLNSYFGVVPLMLVDWLEIIIAGLAIFVIGLIGGGLIRRATGEFD
ncbi:MAG TPA: cation-translocating P-type ATPase [Candidatus Nanoarchaeia archaeon]|nr:cation-translocating P-type ATPase [Candidatus Nanoarchaeia archaeon]